MKIERCQRIVMNCFYLLKNLKRKFRSLEKRPVHLNKSVVKIVILFKGFNQKVALLQISCEHLELKDVFLKNVKLLLSTSHPILHKI